jgi:putative transposase
MQDSHTHVSADGTADDSSPLRLVPARTAGLPAWLAGRVDEHLAAFAAHMTQGLLAASTAVGLEVMGELMDVEVTELAGPKGKHDPARVAMRHGSEQGTVTLGGRRLGVRRPRVRSTGEDAHEVPLESYTAFTSTDLLAEGIVARMLAGLSTRRYPAGLEPVGEHLDARPVGLASRRSRAGLWRRPPSGWPRCWHGGWRIGVGWWCSWTASGWASTCWSARWASPTTAPRSPRRGRGHH